MINYKKAELNEDEVNQLIELSKIWVEENCSYGMRANTRDDLKDTCFIALDENKIVGYAFGHYYTEDQKSSTIEVGSKCFELDELYVLSEFRNQGIGNELYKMIENEVDGKCDYITIATSTKDYKKILKFYVDENQVGFHSAFLIKEMKK